MPKDEKLKFNLPELEEKTLKFWEERKIFKKSLEKNKKGKVFVFYEGPPTANGAPGIHHLEARAFKDIICRYKTMRGFFVPRRAGWDTHGLPVEIQVEKELGFKTKQDIEKYGIGRFNAKAKESVWRYKEEWERLTKRMGFWIDLEHPYITYETTYIETLWWIIKEFWKKRLLYEDFKVVPWCPRCQTGLSSHEVGLGYKEVEDTAVYVKFELEDEPGTYVLAWTTTPWTLPGNVALAVKSEILYIQFKTLGDNPKKIIIAKDLAVKIFGVQDGRIYKRFTYDGEEYTYNAEFRGSRLTGRMYKPLFEVPQLHNDKSYRIYAAPFVSVKDGTGVVHTAVMYGEDDYRLGSEAGLPKYHTVTEDGKFIPEVKELGGLYVKDPTTEEKIIGSLEERGLLFKKEKYLHEYPYCWRCETPLLYYARKAWWVKTTAVKKQMLASNEKINWIPEHIKHGRFGEFLRDLRDWAFSRERYWGTPLPIWKCESCGGIEVIGSVAELEKRADRVPCDEDGEVNLHRPYVDELTFDCKKCGSAMRRVPEVADVWFDSGAMPFASVERQTPNAKRQRILFPADYICEAVDQTRGWFYTLLAVATLLGKGAPYKNVISLGHVLDKNGQKMSKSKGNVVNPWDMIQKYGIDTLRWYFYTINAPGEPKRFNEKDVLLRLRGFVGTLWNAFVFFDTYVDKILNPKSQNSKYVLDRWILAKLDVLIAEVTEKLDDYDIVGAARAIEGFTINDFSQWYIRRSRRRFQRPETEREKNEAAATTGYVLTTVCRLSAPFAPFISDAIWQKLRKKTSLKEESAHLAQWPLPKRIRNQESGIMKDMETIRAIVAEGLRLRAEAGIRVRQPLRELRITNQELRKRPELLELIRDEVNVKEIAFGNELKLDTTITPGLREQGIVREFIRAVQEMRRDLGLKPHERIRGAVSGVKTVTETLMKYKQEIMRETNMRALTVGERGPFTIERETTINGGVLRIGVGL